MLIGIWILLALKAVEPVISKALGHANPRNTLIYIRQLSDEQLATANNRLLGLILNE